MIMALDIKVDVDELTSSFFIEGAAVVEAISLIIEAEAATAAEKSVNICTIISSNRSTSTGRLCI